MLGRDSGVGEYLTPVHACFNLKHIKSNKKKSVPRQRKHHYTNVISATERIEVKYWSINGKPVKFSVCYQCLIAGEWKAIGWCDDSHEEKGLPGKMGLRGHCHIFQAENGEIVWTEVLLGPGSPADHLTGALDNFRDNHQTIFQNYRLAGEKAARQRKNR